MNTWTMFCRLTRTRLLIGCSVALIVAQMFLLRRAFNQKKVYVVRSGEETLLESALGAHEFHDVGIEQNHVPLDANEIVDQDVFSYVENLQKNQSTRIAIGCAITSFGIRSVDRGNFTKYAFFGSLLSTFCMTASAGYDYHIYLAFDQSDPVFNNLALLRRFYSTFHKQVQEMKCNSTFKTQLHFVKCRHDKSPAWAQNDAMMEAYLDGASYFYRVNDDTIMLTSNWTELFIYELAHFKPPNVGVVGPEHSGGKTDILTYDFVHRTHIDIFGFYYPRTFPGWYADAWISAVYGTNNTAKLAQVNLEHMKFGRRYPTKGELGILLPDEVKRGNATLLSFLDWTKSVKPLVHSTKVISISLYGNTPERAFGALRNAHLAQVHFPGWVLRIYLPSPKLVEQDPDLAVPPRIIKNLRGTSAQLVFVNAEASMLPPEYWNHLVADDTTVNSFIVRDAAGRLSARDAAAVAQWIKSKKAIHIIRDHFAHIHSILLDNLWGGRPKDLKQLLPKYFIELLLNIVHEYQEDVHSELKLAKPLDVLADGDTINRHSKEWSDYAVVEQLLFPYLSDHAFCNDGIRCFNDSTCLPIAIDRTPGEYLGQEFGAMGQGQQLEDTQGYSLPTTCEWPHEQKERLDREFAQMKLVLRKHEKLKERRRKRGRSL